MAKIEIPKKLNDDLWEYCRLNSIPNIEEFTIKRLMEGFNTFKYGSQPGKVETKIKEVEKIVEKIVEKKVYVTDDSKFNEITEKLNLKTKENQELSDKIKELELKIKKPNRDIYGDRT
jgi:peptidoglycan hydrolase CwlO-like protein